MHRITTALLLATAAIATADPKPELPNIILIYADDLGWGDVSAYGATAVKTPEIDRLAKEGIRFTSGYAGSSTPFSPPSGSFNGLHPKSEFLAIPPPLQNRHRNPPGNLPRPPQSP